MFSKYCLDVVLENNITRILYSIKFYTGIALSISSALSTCVIFILVMQLANGAKSNYNFINNFLS